MAYDFVIVGGGVHGSAAAYQLALQGVGSVAVFEAGSIAGEASGGFGKRGVRANRRDLREMALMREAYELWPSLADELGADTGYERTGGIYLVEGDAQSGHKGLASIDAVVQAQTQLGIPTERWGKGQVKGAYPAVNDEVQAGIHAPLDGVASHENTTRAYALAAQRLGVTFFESTRITALDTSADGTVQAVLTEQGTRHEVGRRLLLANNGGTNTLLVDAFGQSIPLWTIYPQAVLLRAEDPAQIPMLTAHDSRPLSVKIVEDDIVMLSGGWRGRRDEHSGRGATINANIHSNVEQLHAVFPTLGDLEILEADASRSETASVDQIPIIGMVAPNTMVAAGWSGHGWALVPSVSKHIARALLTGDLSAQLHPFTPQRFRAS